MMFFDRPIKIKLLGLDHSRILPDGEKNWSGLDLEHRSFYGKKGG